MPDKLREPDKVDSFGAQFGRIEINQGRRHLIWIGANSEPCTLEDAERVHEDLGAAIAWLKAQKERV